jgi:hypothetical protein
MMRRVLVFALLCAGMADAQVGDLFAVQRDEVYGALEEWLGITIRR